MSTPRISVRTYLEQQLALCDRPQTEIASASGYINPNMITMLKKGRTKLPLAKVGAIAGALGIDASYLLRIAYREYEPEVWAVIEEVLSDDCLPTQGERDLIRYLRSTGGDSPMDFSAPENLRILGDALRHIERQDQAKAQAAVEALNRLPNNGRHRRAHPA